MKRQMIAAIMGMTMVLGSTGLAMADTPQKYEAAETVPAKSVALTIAEPGESVNGSDAVKLTFAGKDGADVKLAARLDDAYDPEKGLSVFRMGKATANEDGGKTAPVVSGSLDREDFGKVLSALGLSEEEQAERLAAYDDFAAIQKEISEAYRNAEDADEGEWEQMFEEVAKLREKQVSPFTDDVIDKALEMGMLEEEDVFFCKAESAELSYDGEPAQGDEAFKISLTAVPAGK